jgi:SAM-dependent methyltransferase
VSDTKWLRYYAAAGDAPRETLLEALALIEAEGRAPGAAVDLGCGTGRDTLELLRRGWRVVAVDAEPAAIDALRSHPDAVEHESALETVVAQFDEVALPRAELVNASVALPFCRPPVFGAVWAAVCSSLRPGGRFCGHLFGDRDGWAPAPDMTFHSQTEVEALLDGFEIERLDEVEEDGRTAVGDAKHWHVFHVVARSVERPRGLR